MLKLFVADDENWVRQGLRLTIDWAAYGIEWAGEAENGEDALRFIGQDVPDIILTDIKMPCMDGLVFMEELKKRGIAAKVIFISGYDHFAYAQKAVQLGAFDYVLKPLEETVLLGVIERCVNEIRAEKEKTERIKEMSGRFRESLPLARQRFLESCLLEGSIPNLHAKWEALNIGLNEERMLVVAATVHEWKTQGLDETGFSLFRFGLGNIAEELFTAAGIPCVSCPMQRHDTVDLAVILTPKPHDANARADAGSGADVAGAARKWIAEAERVLGLKISVGLSSAANRQELSRAFTEAVANAANGFYTGPGKLHLPDGRQLPETRSGLTAIDPAWVNRAAYALKLGDHHQLHKLLDELSAHLASLRDKTPALHVRRSVNLLMQSIISKWEERFSQMKDSGSAGLPFERRLALNRFVLADMKTAFVSAFDTGAAGALPNPKHTTQLALDYIHRNYLRNIGLNEVSAELYISPSYFSRIFHEEMGETFSKYIIRLRMKKAKELLRETTLRIYEIADKVGYKDHRHFVKTFKETEGVTPAEFRNSGI